MTSREQLLVWLEDLRATGVLRRGQVKPAVSRVTWARKHEVVAFLEGDTDVLGREVRVRVGVTAAFPDVLPYVQLSAADEDLTERVTDHLESDGNVCFTESRDMVFDPERPADLLAASLQAALDTLAAAWTAPDNHEVLDEFASHWSHAQPDRRQVPPLPVYFTPDDGLRKVHAWRETDIPQRQPTGKPVRPTRGRQAPAPAIIAVADDPEAPNTFNPLRERPFGPPGGTALYLPLEASPALLPPTPRWPWSAAKFRRIVRDHLSPLDLARLDALLAGRRVARDLVILGIPRPSGSGIGSRAAVAVRLSGMKGGHVLMADGGTAGVRLEMQSVTRRDRAFIMQRGGSDDQLSRRRMLLLGCGALGGHLAFMLAAAGVGHLTLVDHDYFTHDNTFRHVLGRRFVGHEKVKGMARALRERYPYLEVTPCFGRTAQVTASGQVDPGAFDLIVDATGSATHHLRLARLLKEHGAHPPVLLSWLEVLGLGGHTATIFHDQPGCPRCLYADPRAPLWNVAAFSAPGQHLGRDALGCGTYFTPFSDLDAIRTAEFTARRAVAILSRQETRNLLHSWKGDPDAFLAAGHRLAKRFKVKRRYLRAGVPYASVTCPCCGRIP